MMTEANVAALRNLLVDYGRIERWSKAQTDMPGRYIDTGEWLVSLLSHDQTLLEAAVYRESLIEAESAHLCDRGESVDEYDSDHRQLICIYIDTVKFLWLNLGVSTTLEFIKSGGLRHRLSSGLVSGEAAEKYLDSLVVIVMRKLRAAGVKHRDYARFFAL